jgi:hypothetical protein
MVFSSAMKRILQAHSIKDYQYGRTSRVSQKIATPQFLECDRSLWQATRSSLCYRHVLHLSSTGRFVQTPTTVEHQCIQRLQSYPQKRMDEHGDKHNSSFFTTSANTYVEWTTLKEKTARKHAEQNQKEPFEE